MQTLSDSQVPSLQLRSAQPQAKVLFQVGGISTLFCSTARMPLSVHTICPTGSLSSTQNESTHYNKGRENELHYSIGDGKVIPNIHTSILTTGPERWSMVSPRSPALQASPPALLSTWCAPSSQACLLDRQGCAEGSGVLPACHTQTEPIQTFGTSQVIATLYSLKKGHGAP